jgi:RNA-directed DNA polymerase
MVAKLHAIKLQLRYRRHQLVALVGAWLQKVVTGYSQYHAVPGNLDRMRVFRQRLARLWRSSLCRPGQRHTLRWDRFNLFFNRWIPIPRVLHHCPLERFRATHPRWEAVCMNVPVRLCAGGDQQWSSLPRRSPKRRRSLKWLQRGSLQRAVDKPST